MTILNTYNRLTDEENNLYKLLTPSVKKVFDKVKDEFKGETSGHDWEHIFRVVKLAFTIYHNEITNKIKSPTNESIVILSALVHDVGDWKFNDSDYIGNQKVVQLLTDCQVETDIILQVYSIVTKISFKGLGVPDTPLGFEGQCVQDADRIDAIGAIGIARCFAYGGSAGNVICDPTILPVIHESEQEYKKSKSTSLNHFYEKLIHIKDRINTNYGKKLADKRHKFLVRFLTELEEEL